VKVTSSSSSCAAAAVAAAEMSRVLIADAGVLRADRYIVQPVTDTDVTVMSKTFNFKDANSTEHQADISALYTLNSAIQNHNCSLVQKDDDFC